MKKILNIIITIGLCLTLSCNSVFAEDTTYVEGTLLYTINENDEITIIGYYGRDEEVTVPSSIAGLRVCYIAAGAFANTDAKSVSLPDTIVGVEDGAFDSSVAFNFHENDDVSNQDETNNNNDDTDTYSDSSDDESLAPEPIAQVDLDDAVGDAEAEFSDEEDAEIEEDATTTSNKKNNTNTNKSNEADDSIDESTTSDNSGIIILCAAASVVVIGGGLFIIRKHGKQKIKK